MNWSSLLLALFVSAAQCVEILNMTIMSYNLRCSVCDFEDPWKDRLVNYKDTFYRYQPDIVGTQEIILSSQAEEVLQILPTNNGQEWDVVYYKGLLHDPDASIFYRKDIFSVTNNGNYWLSPTPDKPFSKGFSPDHQVVPRTVAWAEMVHTPSNTPFFFATTHFDNNFPCQEKSAPLVLNETAPFAAKMPIIFVGDFNSPFTSYAWKNLTTPPGSDGFYFLDSFNLAASWQIETNQSPVPEFDPTQEIDHIFVQSQLPNITFKVPEWYVDMYAYPHKNQTYPSDHFAIAAHVQLIIDN